MKHVSFTQMKDGSQKDYEFLAQYDLEYAQGTADRLVEALTGLDDVLSGYQVSRLGHSLQTASRAWHDGADIDWVISALLHDLGDVYAPFNHDEYAATILRPFVREQCTWCIQKHGDFQMIYFAHHLGGNPNKRDQYKASPYFDDCAEFCERWDQASFDPNYETLTLEFFIPMLNNIFARVPYDTNILCPGVRKPLVNSDIATHRTTHK